MPLDFAHVFSEAIEARLRRSAWADFPEVIIHAEESAVKSIVCTRRRKAVIRLRLKAWC